MKYSLHQRTKTFELMIIAIIPMCPKTNTNFNYVVNLILNKQRRQKIS